MISLMKMFTIILYDDVSNIEAIHFNKITDYVDKFNMITGENYGDYL